jgi:GAF domain-containing protein
MADHPSGWTAIHHDEPHLVMERATGEVSRSIPTVDGCLIALVDGDELVCESGLGTFADALGLRVKVNESLAGLSLRTGRPFRCDDAETNTWVDRAMARRFNASSILSAPLKNGNQSFGALVAISSVRAAFNSQDVQIFSDVAQSASDELTTLRARGLRLLTSRRK